ncbi:CLUMA_CG007316, isoform A [Clunio marinus]|uniref:CLUMA_CG007316, isoform A n=1 Tax=Clunio marinus TaxID=568069 RepID=A0A1J1I2G8_9DIPT|nr:CLUMA_CG007316, isoform A [Clunio marinus]
MFKNCYDSGSVTQLRNKKSKKLSFRPNYSTSSQIMHKDHAGEAELEIYFPLLSIQPKKRCFLHNKIQQETLRYLIAF